MHVFGFDQTKNIRFLKYNFIKINSLCEEKINILHLHLSFIILPIKRVIEAYCKKTLKAYPYDLAHVKIIDKGKLLRYWKNIKTIAVLKTGATIQEIVLYLVDSDEEDGFRNCNEYWGSYKELGKTSYAEFDYIDKFQYLIDDSLKILNLLNVKNVIKFPENPTNKYVYI